MCAVRLEGADQLPNVRCIYYPDLESTCTYSVSFAGPPVGRVVPVTIENVLSSDKQDTQFSTSGARSFGQHAYLALSVQLPDAHGIRNIFVPIDFDWPLTRIISRLAFTTPLSLRP